MADHEVCDRETLLALADELEERWHLFDDADALSICERIREACGAREDYD